MSPSAPQNVILQVLTPAETARYLDKIMVIRKRLNIEGPALAFLTTVAHQHAPIFGEGRVAKIVIDQLRETATHFQVSIVGYVLMPTHLHMLLAFPDIALLSRFMQTFKILSSKAVKGSERGRPRGGVSSESGFRLWRARFDDLIVTSEKQYRIKLEYIHNNPVRAGLVSRASQWPYSSAADWLENKPGLLPVDKHFSWLCFYKVGGR